MVWIVDYAVAQGWRVSGSELVKTAITERLEERGVEIQYGTSPEFIPEDVTEAVITSAITPSSPSYPILQELEKRKILVMKRAAWIGKITRQKYTIAVAGTHGKTTTTAMVGWILQKAGMDPTVFVGGTLKEWDNATLIGKSEYLVLEADEFDRSFHQFSAQAAIILNIDADHLDYYSGGISEIEHSFRRFLRNLPPHKGVVVGYGRDPHIRKVCKGFSYTFRWYDEERLWPGIHLGIPGEHNLLNATAAARVAHELGVSHNLIKEALSTFPGVGRRFEYLGRWNQVEVYDDYAHHPREVAATLQGAREKFPTERLVVVFQPHQKARTLNLLAEFGRSFDKNPPSELILAPIYQVAGREENLVVSSSDIAAEINKRPPARMKIQVAQSEDQLKSLVERATEESGIVLSMGAGSIRRLFEQWKEE